jgi:hypothetical protein
MIDTLHGSDRLRIDEHLALRHLQTRMRNFYIRIATLILLVVAFFDEVASRFTQNPGGDKASVFWYFDSPTEKIVMGLLAVSLCLFVYSELSRMASEERADAEIDEKLKQIDIALGHEPTGAKLKR